jgi:hypothetical protein
MATYKATFFTLLLAAICSLSLTYCPGEYYFDSEYYRRLEKALLANKNNLYKLHHEFFPTNYASPVYGTITYDICESEPESGNTQLEPTQNLNPATCGTQKYCKKWSSSLLLAHIEPRILNSFQLHALDLAFEFALASDDSKYSSSTPWEFTVCLKMMIDNATDKIPNNMIDEILTDMTPWVSCLYFNTMCIHPSFISNNTV